jgi:predicted MFS family arabinose efflux permease
MESLWNSNYIKVWISNFMIFFSFMLLTPLLPIYMAETFHADKDLIGLVLSGYTLMALLMRPFSGCLVDSFPRKAVLLISYIIFSALFAGYVVAGTILLFAIIRTLHGIPFGAVTVANSTVAIDVLPASRRSEGIGYYGLSNNIATAIGPTIAILIYEACQSYELLFALSLLISAMGFGLCCTLKLPKRETKKRPPISLDRFILLKGKWLGMAMCCYSFSYGVLATYIAIYGKQELGITSGTGLFFMILSIGLILSHLVGSRSLRKGRIVENASFGVVVSLFGYLLFAAVHNPWGFYGAALIIGLGNGHMFPAFQNMFINLASHEQRGTANSTLLVSWDIGMGLGIILGGTISEHLGGYMSAFVAALIIYTLGAIFYFLYAKKSFLKNRLR